MKTRLLLHYYSFLVVCALLISGGAYSQITYNAPFNNGVSNWDTVDFYHDEENMCQGNGAISANLYDGTYFAAAFSPGIGTSNGGVVTFNYRYKIVEFDDPTVAIQNSDDWGLIQVFWSTDPNGEYTLLQAIDPTNHIVSANCAQKSATFQPPLGSTVYLAVYAEIDNTDLDYYVVFDQVQVTQAAPAACNGTPVASPTVATRTVLCNGQSTTLSLNVFNSGLTYQWQSSPDNVTYTNVPTGGTGLTYTPVQTASTWYRAVVTCTSSAQSVNSIPVQVVSTGSACPCDIDFPGAVEPITNVNFAGIDNASSAAVDSTPALQDFTMLPPGEVTAGESYPIALEGNTADDGFGDFENYFSIFIDWNHDGDYSDAGETYELEDFLIYSDGTDGQQSTGIIAVPENAVEGPTYMRVVKNWYDMDAEIMYGGACTDDNSGYGQAEDYILNVSGPAEIGWLNLQHPPTMALTTGNTDVAYARVWAGGITEDPGAGAGITVWIGISPAGSNTNPSTWTTWIPATYNAAAEPTAGNNDEYMATIGAGLAPGTYYYASRAQLNGGPYSYGGYNSTGGGFWDGTTNVSGVLTVICSTAAPTAIANQAFCPGATVADLQATGTVISWYSAATGGTALAPTTVLANGNYYASITLAGGCESITRTAVAVVITQTPAPVAPANQSFCPGTTVASLQATGSVISWYSTATGGTALTSTTELVNGTYYASITPAGGCESVARTAVTVVITQTPAPDADAEQTFCAGSTIDDLEAEGDMITWYSAAIGGNAVADNVVLTDNTTYYASVAPTGGCESIARTAVTVVVTTTTAPTVTDATQTFCNEADLDDLEVDADGDIVWYAAETGGTPLNEGMEVTSGTTYYAAQINEGCESPGRTAVTVQITVTDIPSGDQTQDIEAATAADATIEDIQVTATGTITWYASAEDAEDGENALVAGTMITDGSTYYATQTIDDCESLGFAVTVAVTLDNGEFSAVSFTYHPNPVKDMLTLSYDKNISSVEVYNIVGQKVIAKTIGQNQAQIDMSQLAAGTYMVKVMSDTASKTIKVVKQ